MIFWLLVSLKCSVSVMPMRCDYFALESSPEFASEQRCRKAASTEIRRSSTVNGITCVEKAADKDAKAGEAQ